MRLPTNTAVVGEVEMFGLHVVPHVTFHPRIVVAVCAVIAQSRAKIYHFGHDQVLMIVSGRKI